MDQATFLSTVPPYMVIGRNYTVVTTLTSSLPTTVNVTVELIVPLNYMVVQPLVNQFHLAPGESTTASFTIIAYQAHEGTLNVTAEVWATNSTSGAPTVPILKLDAQVYDIQEPDSLGLGVSLLVILIAATLVVVYWRRASRG